LTPATLVAVSGRPTSAEALFSVSDTFPSGEMPSEAGVADKMQAKTAVAPTTTIFDMVVSLRRCHHPGALSLQTRPATVKVTLDCGPSHSAVPHRISVDVRFWVEQTLRGTTLSVFTFAKGARSALGKFDWSAAFGESYQQSPLAGGPFALTLIA
jgi:hypothetical protein